MSLTQQGKSRLPRLLDSFIFSTQRAVGFVDSLMIEETRMANEDRREAGGVLGKPQAEECVVSDFVVAPLLDGTSDQCSRRRVGRTRVESTVAPRRAAPSLAWPLAPPVLSPRSPRIGRRVLSISANLTEVTVSQTCCSCDGLAEWPESQSSIHLIFAYNCHTTTWTETETERRRTSSKGKTGPGSKPQRPRDYAALRRTGRLGASG